MEQIVQDMFIYKGIKLLSQKMTLDNLLTSHVYKLTIHIFEFSMLLWLFNFCYELMYGNGVGVISVVIFATVCALLVSYNFYYQMLLLLALFWEHGFLLIQVAKNESSAVIRQEVGRVMSMLSFKNPFKVPNFFKEKYKRITNWWNYDLTDSIRMKLVGLAGIIAFGIVSLTYYVYKREKKSETVKKLEIVDLQSIEKEERKRKKKISDELLMVAFFLLGIINKSGFKYVNNWKSTQQVVDCVDSLFKRFNFFKAHEEEDIEDNDNSKCINYKKVGCKATSYDGTARCKACIDIETSEKMRGMMRQFSDEDINTNTRSVCKAMFHDYIQNKHQIPEWFKHLERGQQKMILDSFRLDLDTFLRNHVSIHFDQDLKKYIVSGPAVAAWQVRSFMNTQGVSDKNFIQFVKAGNLNRQDTSQHVSPTASTPRRQTMRTSPRNADLAKQGEDSNLTVTVQRKDTSPERKPILTPIEKKKTIDQLLCELDTRDYSQEDLTRLEEIIKMKNRQVDHDAEKIIASRPTSSSSSIYTFQEEQTGDLHITTRHAISPVREEKKDSDEEFEVISAEQPDNQQVVPAIEIVEGKRLTEVEFNIIELYKRYVTCWRKLRREENLTAEEAQNKINTIFMLLPDDYKYSAMAKTVFKEIEETVHFVVQNMRIGKDKHKPSQDEAVEMLPYIYKCQNIGDFEQETWLYNDHNSLTEDNFFIKMCTWYFGEEVNNLFKKNAQLSGISVYIQWLICIVSYILTRYALYLVARYTVTALYNKVVKQEPLHIDENCNIVQKPLEISKEESKKKASLSGHRAGSRHKDSAGGRMRDRSEGRDYVYDSRDFFLVDNKKSGQAFYLAYDSSQTLKQLMAGKLVANVYDKRTHRLLGTVRNEDELKKCLTKHGTTIEEVTTAPSLTKEDVKNRKYDNLPIGVVKFTIKSYPYKIHETIDKIAHKQMIDNDDWNLFVENWKNGGDKCKLKFSSPDDKNHFKELVHDYEHFKHNFVDKWIPRTQLQQLKQQVEDNASKGRTHEFGISGIGIDQPALSSWADMVEEEEKSDTDAQLLSLIAKAAFSEKAAVQARKIQKPLTNDTRLPIIDEEAIKILQRNREDTATDVKNSLGLITNDQDINKVKERLRSLEEEVKQFEKIAPELLKRVKDLKGLAIVNPESIDVSKPYQNNGIPAGAILGIFYKDNNVLKRIAMCFRTGQSIVGVSHTFETIAPKECYVGHPEIKKVWPISYIEKFPNLDLCKIYLDDIDELTRALKDVYGPENCKPISLVLTDKIENGWLFAHGFDENMKRVVKEGKVIDKFPGHMYSHNLQTRKGDSGMLISDMHGNCAGIHIGDAMGGVRAMIGWDDFLAAVVRSNESVEKAIKKSNASLPSVQHGVCLA